MVGAVCYHDAVRTLFSSAWLAKHDPKLLEVVTDGTALLDLSPSAMERSFVTEHLWADSVREEVTIESQIEAYSDEKDRMF